MGVFSVEWVCIVCVIYCVLCLLWSVLHDGCGLYYMVGVVCTTWGVSSVLHGGCGLCSVHLKQGKLNP
jgi:hypothetical protein